MTGNHRAIIHLIDMIPRQNQNILRVVIANDVQVLVDSVGSTGIPGRPDTLLGRQQLDKFTELTAQKTPAALDMLEQGVRLVLGQNTYPPNSGVHAIGERKVDDTEFSAKRDCRFGTP